MVLDDVGLGGLHLLEEPDGAEQGHGDQVVGQGHFYGEKSVRFVIGATENIISFSKIIVIPQITA